MGYRECPYCGASLDPGEICDCEISATELVSLQKKSVDEKAIQSAENIKNRN